MRVVSVLLALAAWTPQSARVPGGPGWVTLAAGACVSSAGAAPGTCGALGDLYASTGGPSWSVTRGWSAAWGVTASTGGAAQDVCALFGVATTG